MNLLNCRECKKSLTPYLAQLSIHSLKIRSFSPPAFPIAPDGRLSLRLGFSFQRPDVASRL
jgi:hypothetical protein